MEGLMRSQTPVRRARTQGGQPLLSALMPAHGSIAAQPGVRRHRHKGAVTVLWKHARCSSYVVCTRVAQQAQSGPCGQRSRMRGQGLGELPVALAGRVAWLT